MPIPYTIGVAANAFKGSLSAVQATDAIAQGFECSRLDCQVKRMPLADGGDGTLEVMLSQPGSTRKIVSVLNPVGDYVEAPYGFLPDGETAIIELALASGLALVGKERDALHATTYGTGELMRHAIESGAKRIILGVGGSATTDGGAGCLHVLGVGLLDAHGNPLGAGGVALDHLAKVIPNPRLAELEILVLCDVDNPPIGENGAAAIFAPQKGATPEQVLTLERNLTHFFTLIAEQTGNDVRTLPGGGAAGAIAGGLAALAGAKLVPGAETIIRFLGYQEQIAGCDLIVTGEGKLDAQTERGKAPAVIAAHAAAQGIPTIAIAGSIPPPDALQNSPIQAAFSLLPTPATLEEAIQHSAEWLTNTAHNLGNLIASLNI
jgi:glycerate kinase